MFAQKPPSDDEMEAEKEIAKMVVVQNAAGMGFRHPAIEVAID
jgi:hypothetical protein